MARRGPRLSVAASLLMLLAACGGTNSPAAQGDVGVTAGSILLGNTISESGRAKAYGTIANAENAYFTYVNNQGGVNGRKIQFKILDDAYNPAQTVPLTKQLVEQDQVFAMFSGLGTQTQTSVQPYLNGRKVPQLFVATGATTFGKDFRSNPWTIGWQPPYQAEARIYTRDVLQNHPGAKIGVLYQNDDYGQDYLRGLKDGLGSSTSLIVDEQSYDVTAADVTSQLVQLKAKGADTVFLFTTPGFTIQALVSITKLGWSPSRIYLNSVSNPQVYMGIAAKAGAALQNVTSAAYIKDPTDPQWANDPGMQLYRQVIATCSTCNPLDSFNIYGVAVAYTMVDVLKQAGNQMTRQNVMSIAANQLNEQNPFLLPGISVRTSTSDHFPIMQQQMINWNGTGWSRQGAVIDARGTIK